MRLVLLAALAVLSAAAISVALRVDGDEKSSRYVSEHPVKAPAISRTVLISSKMPSPSASADQLSAMLQKGQMPAAPTTAEVLTDTDCGPDSQMISHCRNEVRLPDGKKLVLRHPHDMRKVPCLAPGERVRLLPSA